MSTQSFAQAVKFIGCQLFILKFHIIYILPCTYQKISRTSPLISESRCNLRSHLSTLYFVSCPQHRVIKTLHSCSHSHACSSFILALAFSPSPSDTHSHNCVLTLVIMFSCLYLLAFCLLLSHIAYFVKFNYYLIPLIIGRVTHPLTSLSSTSSSVLSFYYCFHHYRHC